jgi:UV DNA damage endonuclease
MRIRERDEDGRWRMEDGRWNGGGPTVGDTEVRVGRSATRSKKSGVVRAGAVWPNLGLVCLSSTDECRYRAITRSRFLSLEAGERRGVLRELYWDNLRRLHWTLGFCARRGIRLYRVTSGLFPMSDEPLGAAVLGEMTANLSAVGRRAERLGIRILAHPDQFVVLNSENPKVVETSRRIMEKHARAFDLMGLPRSPWAALILHGGKAGRAQALIDEIATLPEGVRSRLCLENDEYAYSAGEILEVCRAAGVPMIFDNLHHAIKERIGDYGEASFARFVKAARATWRPHPDWQIVHLSNGAGSVLDRNHSEYITDVPPAYAGVRWIEVEARGKELAIADLRGKWGPKS